MLTANAEHIAGNRGDKAECYGMQLIAPAGARLGLDGKRAVELARLYWREIYLPFEPELRSSKCANGTDLDLRPSDNAWP